MVKWFDSLDKIVRIILFIPFWGWIFSAIYRICTYAEGTEKNVTNLVVGILCIIPIIGFIISILDLVSTITDDKVKYVIF